MFNNSYLKSLNLTVNNNLRIEDIPTTNFVKKNKSRAQTSSQKHRLNDKENQNTQYTEQSTVPASTDYLLSRTGFLSRLKLEDNTDIINMDQLLTRPNTTQESNVDTRPNTVILKSQNTVQDTRPNTVNLKSSNTVQDTRPNTVNLKSSNTVQDTRPNTVNLKSQNTVQDTRPNTGNTKTNNNKNSLNLKQRTINSMDKIKLQENIDKINSNKEENYQNLLEDMLKRDQEGIQSNTIQNMDKEDQAVGLHKQIEQTKDIYKHLSLTNDNLASQIKNNMRETMQKKDVKESTEKINFLTQNNVNTNQSVSPRSHLSNNSKQLTRLSQNMEQTRMDQNIIYGKDQPQYFYHDEDEKVMEIQFEENDPNQDVDMRLETEMFIKTLSSKIKNESQFNQNPEKLKEVQLRNLRQTKTELNQSMPELKKQNDECESKIKHIKLNTDLTDDSTFKVAIDLQTKQINSENKIKIQDIKIKNPYENEKKLSDQAKNSVANKTTFAYQMGSKNMQKSAINIDQDKNSIMMSSESQSLPPLEKFNSNSTFECKNDIQESKHDLSVHSNNLNNFNNQKIRIKNSESDCNSQSNINLSKAHRIKQNKSFESNQNPYENLQKNTLVSMKNLEQAKMKSNESELKINNNINKIKNKINKNHQRNQDQYHQDIITELNTELKNNKQVLNSLYVNVKPTNRRTKQFKVKNQKDIHGGLKFNNDNGKQKNTFDNIFNG